MKSVTEFPTHKLVQGLTAKTGLAAEGKTPEEIQASLGETFKMEGDKLKCFCNALEVAEKNMEGLSRVLVVRLNEGENAPAKATQFEELHYVPEFVSGAKPAPAKTVKDAKGGRGGGRGAGDRKGGPKESPWGLSPEQKAAKKAGNKVVKTDA